MKTKVLIDNLPANRLLDEASELMEVVISKIQSAKSLPSDDDVSEFEATPEEAAKIGRGISIIRDQLKELDIQASEFLVAFDKWRV